MTEVDPSGWQANSLLKLIQRAESVLERVEAMLPRTSKLPDWNTTLACRWRQGSGGKGYLQAVANPSSIPLASLKHIDRQRQLVEQNTRQFVNGRPANNVLLTGARGTGKSSLIKACFQHFAEQGLRLVEVDKDHLVDLPDIVDMLQVCPQKFIIYCDDLSFGAGEGGYKALKVALDGSVAGQADNVLIYASSNRRHLMPEHESDNASYHHTEDGELHPGEVVEEKISLSERFGLWISFYPFKQDQYLEIVDAWLAHYGVAPEQHQAAHEQALQWALQRGSRSGRVALQFAKDFAGKTLA